MNPQHLLSPFSNKYRFNFSCPELSRYPSQLVAHDDFLNPETNSICYLRLFLMTFAYVPCLLFNINGRRTIDPVDFRNRTQTPSNRRNRTSKPVGGRMFSCFIYWAGAPPKCIAVTLRDFISQVAPKCFCFTGLNSLLSQRINHSTEDCWQSYGSYRD